MDELEMGARNKNEACAIKKMQGVGENNTSNDINMDAPQTIPIGINNELGHNTPQKNIIHVNLSNTMKSVNPSAPSDLSRNKSDAASTTSSFETIKK